MASGPGSKRKSARGSVAGLPTASAHAVTIAGHTHIEALIHGGGQIMIGTMQPIRRAAVAHDGNKTLAMLRCKANESLAAILLRLETAIATARASGQRVDEINRPGADRTYEY
ncbi:MAG: hypothetical protein IPP88_13650 [Betaproteobacteria bacterium]|nr:hypothetical protein [Betaproteobacteria bacterium]